MCEEIEEYDHHKNSKFILSILIYASFGLSFVFFTLGMFGRFMIYDMRMCMAIVGASCMLICVVSSTLYMILFRCCHPKPVLSLREKYIQLN